MQAEGAVTAPAVDPLRRARPGDPHVGGQRARSAGAGNAAPDAAGLHRAAGHYGVT